MNGNLKEIYHSINVKVNVAIANDILCEVSDSVDVKVNVESINAVTGSQEKEMPHSPKKRKIP